MYLIECLNNNETKNCNTLICNSKMVRLEFTFDTTLEDVAYLQDSDGLILITNHHQNYLVSEEDALSDTWQIK